jgi:hypothetical protein
VVRPVAVGLGTLGPPAALFVVYPPFALVLSLVEAAVVLAIVILIVITVLYGSDITSERTFRLLRWAANRPEPDPPERAEVDAGPTAPTRRLEGT